MTTCQPRDVPRVLERVATLDGFINANINAQVQGYIVSRDYQEGSVVKKGDLAFSDRSAAVRGCIGTSEGHFGKRQSQPG